MKGSFLLLLGCLNLAMAQQMPVDFEENEDVFNGFGGSTFARRADPIVGSNQVGEFFNSGTEVIQGCFIDLTQPIVLDSQQILSLDFYAFDPNSHTVTVKLEAGSNPDVEVTRSITSQGWTDSLLFDFSSATQTIDGTTVSASGAYSRLVIFIDLASATPGTYLIDNISDGTAEVITPIDTPQNAVYDYLVWSDEFDGEGSLDETKWFQQTLLPNGQSWFNGEQQHYTNQNTFVQGGALHIVARREQFTDQGVTKSFTSARLNSKYAFTYGRVDVRAKLPAGGGTWPAIWTLGQNISENGAYWQSQGYGTTSWPACGEIDIMEHGLGAVDYVSSAIHTPSSFGGTVNYASKQITNVSENFHLYSMIWSPNQIIFLIDSVAYYTYQPSVKNADTWPFDLPQYLLLNVAMGGVAGTIDASFSESSMIVDYVRVYQQAPGASGPLLGQDSANAPLVWLYPNPANDILLVKSESTMQRFVIHDMKGRQVFQKEVQTQEAKLDLSQMDRGVYILSIQQGSTITQHKVRVE